MKLSHVLAGLIGVSLAVGLLRPIGIRFNLTASLPLGIYRVSAEPPARGSIVHVCLSRDVAEFAQARGYLGPGRCPSGVRPLGKIVLAAEGDLVTLERDAILVNGEVIENSSTLSTDSRGRPLPHYEWGDHRIASEGLWLFSPYHRYAYDSRYFGPIHTSQVVSVLRPLWTQLRVSTIGTSVRRNVTSCSRGRTHCSPVIFARGGR
jgi:conjugative transfer signal peptidase TraF